jgi:drug/metabolite transporter (DMT)-like permease
MLAFMWFTLALVASVAWGLVYVLSEQLYKSLSVPSVLALQMLVVAAVAVIFALLSGQLRTDLAVLLGSRQLMLFFVASVLAWVAASFLIGFSIAGKDATLAGLIEMSYPLFIALFAYLIFGEAQLSLATALGGALILAGVGVVFFAA